MFIKKSKLKTHTCYQLALLSLLLNFISQRKQNQLKLLAIWRRRRNAARCLFLVQNNFLSYLAKMYAYKTDHVLGTLF